MTLAVVLSFCAFLSTPVFSGTAPIWAQTAPQEASPQKPSDSSTQAGGDSSKTQTPPTATQAPSSQTQAAGKPATRKVKKSKKTKTANCVDAATAGSSTATPPSANGNTASAVATPCPPPITVVHDGGAADPAIKLSGGTEAAQPSAKHAPDQLVVSTEQNLKKVEGRELNASQKEMLTQIHQFLEQSKAATAAGDIDRGHNLALKARLLSDELTKP